MSNSYDNERTWAIDTAENIDGTYLVDDFMFYPAAKNNDLVITDAAGDEIWTIRGVASASNNEAFAIETKEYKAGPRKCRGIYITTIDGGTLRVHLNEKSPLA